MDDEKQAVAEGILERIWKEEWHDLDLLLGRTGDVQFWTNTMRYELDLQTLTKGLLRGDSTLASLKDLQVDSMSPFHYAGLRGAGSVLRSCLQVGLNVEVGLRSGTTVLHLASFAGKMETLTLLVDEFKADVNREDGHRRSPLHYASAQGHQQVVKFLASRGADIGARDFEGATAAHHARLNGHQPIVSYLIEVSRDGEVLLVEDQSLVSEVQRANEEEGSPLYTRIHKKNRKLLVPDYEEVELSSGTDTRVETVNENPDAKDNSWPANGSKAAIKSGKRILYENTEIPCSSVSLLETGNGYSSVFKTSLINDEKDTSSCAERRPVFKTSSDSASNSTDLNEHVAVSQCDESNVILKRKLESGKRQHHYEEITLPIESETDAKFLDGHACAEDSITTNKGNLGRQEIELPTNITQHSNNRYTPECAEDKPNVTFKSPRRKHQYEEINLPCESPNPNSNIVDNSATEAEMTEAFDVSKFVRRKHHYEEITLPGDEHEENEHQVEEDVRQLLRSELRKLEMRGKYANVDKPLSQNTDAIKDFPDVSEISENVAADSHYDVETVITLHQLRRLLREEFRKYAEQLRSKEPLSTLGVPKEDSTKVLTSKSTLKPSSTAGLYDESSASGEAVKIETTKSAAKNDNNPRQEGKNRKEKNRRDYSPLNLFHSIDRKKPETTENTNKESKFNRFSLHPRRELRNGKDKGDQSWSLHRSPLRLNAQNDRQTEADGSKVEDGLQNSEELSFKPGQSKFYIGRKSTNSNSTQI